MLLMGNGYCGSLAVACKRSESERRELKSIGKKKKRERRLLLASNTNECEIRVKRETGEEGGLDSKKNESENSGGGKQTNKGGGLPGVG